MSERLHDDACALCTPVALLFLALTFCLASFHADVTRLHDRVERRDAAIQLLREELRACRAALGQAAPADHSALDALSAVDWAELDDDKDPVLPTYKLHGLCAPGSNLLNPFKPAHSPIPEEAVDGAAGASVGTSKIEAAPLSQHDVVTASASNAVAEDEDDDMDEDDADEYTVRRRKRRTSSNGTIGVSTRNAARAAARA